MKTSFSCVLTYMFTPHRRVLLLQVLGDQPQLLRRRFGLAAAADAQLVQNVADVGLYRGQADGHDLADLRVALVGAEKVQNLQLSVRQTELMCKNMSKPSRKEPAPAPAVNYIAVCERDLSRSLGRGVKIHHGKRKGRLELEYYGEDDLQRLLDALDTIGGKEKP